MAFTQYKSEIIILMSVNKNCTVSALEDAARTLISGNLVVFPTETVYGLGADATNPNGVAKIYKVKGRPTSHPLIVHISSLNNLNIWAKYIPEYAIKLAKVFWPGPLTLILQRSEIVKDFITGGQNNVGIRVPSNPIALSLLERFEAKGGLGIAAPSANLFGGVSPTSAIAAKEDLHHKLSNSDRILDGGSCTVGIESTIVDCTQIAPTILRPGAVTSDMIKNLLGFKLDLSFDYSVRIHPKVSGSYKSHYAPKAQVIIDGNPEVGDGLIALASTLTPIGVVRLAAPETSQEFAKVLYEAYRLADIKNLRKVCVQLPTGDGIELAIQDRVERSAYKPNMPTDGLAKSLLNNT